VALESEFERFLLVKDGIGSPHTFDAGKFLKLTRGEAVTAAEFYPGATGGRVSRSIRLMGLFIRLLAHPNRKLQEAVLEKTAPGLLQFRIPTEASDELAPYVSELYGLFSQAQERYPALLREVSAHLESGEAFSEAFALPFG